jgi:hypothetical protein
MREPDGRTAATPLPDLILYGKPGCGLCDEARANAQAILGQRATTGLAVPRLVERDITTDPTWERAFFLTIPVFELGDRRLELATSVVRLQALVREVLDGRPAGGPSETTRVPGQVGR